MEIDSIDRSVEPNGDKTVIALTRTYDADIADVWDAVTSPDRLSRWFMPIEGELKVLTERVHAIADVEDTGDRVPRVRRVEQGEAVVVVELDHSAAVVRDELVAQLVEAIDHLGDRHRGQMTHGAGEAREICENQYGRLLFESRRGTRRVGRHSHHTLLCLLT